MTIRHSAGDHPCPEGRRARVAASVARWPEATAPICRYRLPVPVLSDNTQTLSKPHAGYAFTTVLFARISSSAVVIAGLRWRARDETLSRSVFVVPGVGDIHDVL